MGAFDNRDKSIDTEKVSGQHRNMEILNEFQQERDTFGHLLFDAGLQGDY
jgi:hypothetical protein